MSAQVREDMVERAAKFLQHPKVAHATFSRRVSFLEEKNLTKEEIELALQRAAAKAGAPSSGTSSSSATGAAPAAAAAAGAAPTAAPAALAVERFGVKPTGYSEAVLVRPSPASPMLYLSGQAAAQDSSLDATGQTEEVLAKIDGILKGSGSDRAKVVAATLFVRDVTRDGAAVMASWRMWADPLAPPATTVVEAAPAGGAKQLVEIAVTAHV